MIAAWRERDALLGGRIAWDGGEGVAAGIDAAGARCWSTPPTAGSRSTRAKFT